MSAVYNLPAGLAFAYCSVSILVSEANSHVLTGISAGCNLQAGKSKAGPLKLRCAAFCVSHRRPSPTLFALGRNSKQLPIFPVSPSQHQQHPRLTRIPPPTHAYDSIHLSSRSHPKPHRQWYGSTPPGRVCAVAYPTSPLQAQLETPPFTSYIGAVSRVIRANPKYRRTR